MDESVKGHLYAIIGITLLGLITGYIILTRVHDAAGSMSLDTFDMLVIVVPCVIILVCSFAIAATAQAIGRSLFIVVIAISMVAGILSMVVTSLWMDDPAIAAQLLANSPEGTTITPLAQQPVTAFRNIAAYFVVPTIGCIFGAWIGSRLHPLQSANPNAKTAGKQKSKKK